VDAAQVTDWQNPEFISQFSGKEPRRRPFVEWVMPVE